MKWFDHIIKSSTVNAARACVPAVRWNAARPAGNLFNWSSTNFSLILRIRRVAFRPIQINANGSRVDIGFKYL